MRLFHRTPNGQPIVAHGFADAAYPTGQGVWLSPSLLLADAASRGAAPGGDNDDLLLVEMPAASLAPYTLWRRGTPAAVGFLVPAGIVNAQRRRPQIVPFEVEVELVLQAARTGTPCPRWPWWIRRSSTPSSRPGSTRSARRPSPRS